MRKVYHNEKSSLGVVTAIIFSVGITASLFGILPFAHQIARPERSLELRKTTAIDQTPETKEEEAPPQIEEQKPPEAPPEPQLTEAPQQIALSADLDVAVGSGGALAGFGSVQAMAAVETVQQDAFDVGELEKRPEPITQIAPTYPRELIKAKVEGVVTLVFIVSEEGRVEDLRVENSTHPEFEKPALEAFRKWRFRPGEKDGQRVRTFSRKPFRFRPPAG
jgi:periplasmic protein TonB